MTHLRIESSLPCFAGERSNFRMCIFPSDAAFTLNDFDNQERNLTFVKTDFQVLKLKFHACSFKKAFYPLHKLNIA